MIRQLKFFVQTFLLVTLIAGGANAALVENAIVGVKAVVPSKVCPQYSSITSNVTEVLADNSQKIIVTIKTYDCSEVPLADVPVSLTSNRGVLDNIYNQESGTGNGLDGLRAITDENGFVFFEVYSNVPGEVIFSAVADDLVTIGDLKLKFLPLPFPKNVTVTIKVPQIINNITGGKLNKITILSPEEMQYDESKTVNLGVRIDIPFWVAIFIVLSVFSNILLLIIILLLVVRIKAIQKREMQQITKDTEILEKEESQIKEIIEDLSQKK